jgi:hypothetical protein
VAQHFERDVNHFDLSQDRAALRLCGRSAMTLAASSASRAARLSALVRRFVSVFEPLRFRSRRTCIWLTPARFAICR